MPDLPGTASAYTHEALRAREADPARARELLGRALAEDFGYEPAWRWLAELVDDPAERRFCLDKAANLVAEPDTLRARAALGRGPRRPPTEVADLVDPPRPVSVARTRKRLRGKRRMVAIVLAAVLLVTLIAAWTMTGGGLGPTLHIAVVTSGTGEIAEQSAHVERSLRMRVDELNTRGGVAGHRVELDVYDDEGRADRARAVAEEVVRDGRALFVVGHGGSDTALAASPVYRAAGIAAVTPSAGSSRLTDDSEWYFRSMFGNRTQGDFLAAYAAKALGARAAKVVYDDEEYGQSVNQSFSTAFGLLGSTAEGIPVTDDATADDAVRRLADSRSADPVVLATTEKRGLRFVERLREAGFTAPVLGTSSMGTQSVHRALVRDERERGRPGLFTAGLHLATPLALDSLSGPALTWAQDYEKRYGQRPLWPAATARQAIDIGVHAALTGGLGLDESHRGEDRRRLRDALASLKDRKNAFPALLGPLYFSAAGSAQMPVSFVVSDGTRLVSAPVQFTAYDPPSDRALREGLAGGEVIAIDGRYLTLRQVVATGVNLNEVRDLDTRDGTYFVDFFLWLKYNGDHVASDVSFVNSVKPDLKLGQPLRDVTENGRTYRLYRVADRFKNALEFRDFPFDRQALDVRLQNRTRTADEVIYVTDKEILNQSPEEYLRSGTDADAGIDNLPNWFASSVTFAQRTVGSSDALGGNEASGAVSGIYYSQYTADVEIARDVLPFLVKNLLPLVLLIGVTYLSLFFKASDGAAPVSMGVTAILSTAVLLNNVTSQLPSVSYTVALEWGYYAFILLAAMCVLVAMLRKRFVNRGRGRTEAKLSSFARVAYPVFILTVVLGYVVAYA
ncbi:ABC transporter substrate-binding protein [Actinosynnema sp. NPDC047251]|uniref:ABC transporter substrate-binding protein n=1 Tax=Saccharothrix espanaensis TaxID=103731 RepID=UPI0002F0760D|nr:ABC transporter substrate-binding protein [Saccharothrix espanaensis]